MNTNVTQAEVRRLFDYCIETGVLTKNGKRIGWRGWRGYRKIRVNGVKYLEHRIIWLWMTGEWPPNQIDHIDTVPDNNKWANLRLATHAQNCRNRKMIKTKIGGIKGVFPFGREGKYRARIRVSGKDVHLGVFDDPISAHAAYARAAESFFGEFARIH